MAWDKAYRTCGVVTIADRTVRVYKDYATYTSICPPGVPIDARWSGDGVVVTLENGIVVKFDDYASYRYYG
jgi:hypothetical protein